MNGFRYGLLAFVLFFACSCASDRQSRVNRVLFDVVEVERRFEREATRRLSGSDRDREWLVSGIVGADMYSEVEGILIRRKRLLGDNRDEVRQAVELLLKENGAMLSLAKVSRDEGILNRRRFEELAKQSGRPSSIFYRTLSEDIFWKARR